MKSTFLLLTALFLFVSCDDGDISVEELNFDQVATGRCGNILYKIAGNEALILELPQPTAFQNDVTLAGAPISFEINATNRVVYRSYDGEVAALNICGTIPPATPSVTEEWTAASGTIEIVTTPISSAGEFEGGEAITGFRHTITFKNITFDKPGGSQLYETFLFGTYDTQSNPLPLNFDGSLERCVTSGKLFDYVGREGIMLYIDPLLLASEVTPAGSPRTGLINDANVLTYQLFESGNGALSTDLFCTEPQPSLPAILEQWTGEPGVAGESGIIEVTTTTNGSNFLHEIRLINTNLIRGNTRFKLADNFLLGQIITN